MNVHTQLSDAVRQAVEKAFAESAEPQVSRTQDTQFGDYQTSVAMRLGKTLKRNPREVAQQLTETIAWQGLTEAPEIAGPGFINFRLSNDYLGKMVARIAADPRGGVEPTTTPQTVVLDFSSPNVAKRLHVGHLRSTILGDAMTRVLRFLGHHAIADNHVGDWGTQFGLLILAFRRFGDEEAFKLDPVPYLEDLYKRASEQSKQDEAFAAEARAELAKLQKGDPENLALWSRFVEISRWDVERLYGMLGVSFDHWLGESFYNPALPNVVSGLLERGIAREDQGAVVVFFDEPELEKHPFLVQKQDGAFLYSTTDIATIEYRQREWHPQRVLYFVDRRQELHFRQLFTVARKLGYEMALEHIAFGSILNAEGRPLKTREGNTPSLRGLLQEGIDTALALVRENRPDFSAQQAADVSRSVGIGAIKYADLSQNRLTDYKFDLAKMIAFEGNTGPYLQYTYARISSIFRKLGADWTPPTQVRLEAPEEIALARQLTRFEETLLKVAEAAMPNYLCDYLFTLAKAYSTFYTNCPILKSEGETRESRLALCRAVQNQLAAGLGCLGIEPLTEM
ncbi:MAG TPA: arginine--tRNA ligase [Oscillatoriaceae cyanobacterium]